MRVSVIGGGSVGADDHEVAREVGRLLGEQEFDLVCGGRGGVMAAACEGAESAGATTIGILPGEDRDAANEHVDVVIATGLGHARNALVPLNGDAVVAIDGSHGTLSELGFAGVYDRPVAGLGTHDVDGAYAAESPADAVEYVADALDA
ncbi:Rossmann fold nucleotide-binding protein [Halorubellus sp. JP-L1]|uniref:SLOG cluster 4 domain-containing protein n=1 Tax=Halorubellus sp. JP-L1 TaxID=2715753 RepID=UPI001408F4CC|nr:Rossmann fold nucleotide-binding protein [Halorubellus sp. JP-L1]NHN40194.1 Rossmann fold nucleotide-binding protein [Halorubellus sp. JP-L1]